MDNSLEIKNNSLKILHQHKKALITAAAIIITLALLTVSPAFHMPWEHMPDYDDCYPDFEFHVDDVTYYPGNETAFIEIGHISGMTKDNMKNLSFSIREGEIEGENDTRMLINGEPTEGLVASTEKDAPLDFPIQSFNLTVIGGDGDDDYDGNVGFEQGERLYISYYWKNLKYTDYCSLGKYRVNPWLGANQTTLDKLFG